MGRGSVMPSFSKMGIVAGDFKTMGTYPKVDPFMGYGWSFYKGGVNKPIFGGSFSPQKMLRPSKDVVNAKINLWWMDMGNFNSVSEYAGFIYTLHQIHPGSDGMQVLYRPYNDDILVDKAYADGRVDWKYDNGDGTYYTGDKETNFPYLQMCVGRDEVIVSNGMLFHRTMLQQVKGKPDGTLYLDPNVSVTDMSSTYRDDDIGEVMSIRRLSDLSSDVSKPLHNGMCGLTDNYNDSIVFLGMEVEIV